MNKEELVKQLIDSEGTQLTADDQSWLMNLEESQLQKLLPQAKSETTEEVDEPGDPQAAAASAPATLEGYIAQAPAEIQEVLQSGIKMHQARKAKLVKSLLENARNKFSKQYLEQQSLETLENLAALADVKPDYTGAGAVRTQSTNDNVIDPPEELFPVKQAS